MIFNAWFGYFEYVRCLPRGIMLIVLSYVSVWSLSISTGLPDHGAPSSEKSLARNLANHFWGLPWWRSGWESACQCRGHGFEPWSGKIPHAAEQLGPWATTTEPARLELVLRSKRGCNSERPAHRDEEWPPLAATRESPCTEMKTQHSQK